MLVPVGSHVTFSVELAFGTIESAPKTVELSFRSIDGPPKTVELWSIQNENYENLHDFHMIIVILCGALVSNTLCVFG